MIIRLLTAFMAVAAMQSILYRLFALRHFKYTCTLSVRKVNAGETIELYETLENSGFLPLLWLKIETRFNEALYFLKNDNTSVAAVTFHRSVFTAPPYRRIRRTYKVVCTRRGYYKLGASSVTSGDLMGIETSSISFDCHADLYVYPIPLPWQSLSLPTRTWLGEWVVRRFIFPDPFMPAGVRDYAPGDPLHQIHWKASAKTGALVVHRHSYTADANLLVCFNIDAAAGQWAQADVIQSESMEQDVRLLATVLHFALTNGMSAALHTNSISRADGEEVSVSSGYGISHRETLFTALAEMQFRRTRPFPMLLREMAASVNHKDILVMTRYLTNEILAECELLRKAGSKVEILVTTDTQTQVRGDGI